MKKVEPLNGGRVTFSIAKEAANKLKQLAQQNNDQLKRLGILSVQVQGEDIVRLSISNSEGNVQHIIVRQPVNTSALIQHTNDISHGNGPHEFDKILSQLTSGHLQPGTSGYGTSSDSNLFVVPQPTARRRNSRKSKDKTKINVLSNTVNVTPNGLTNINSSGINSHDILMSRMTAHGEPAATDTLGLSDMPNLDLNDLIGGDGTPGQLDLEMVTDILHMDSMNSQQNPTLGMSPSSLNSNQVQSQLDRPDLHNASHSLTNTSDYNTSEVDELFNLKLHSFEAEDAQSTSHLTPSIGDLQYNQEHHHFANVSGPSHVVQRQMSFPQYSTKQGPVHGHNTQGMFTAASGRQSVGPINTGLSSPHHSQHMRQNSVGVLDNGPQVPGMMSQGNQKGNVIGHHQSELQAKMYQNNQIMEKDGNFMGYPPGMGPGNPDMMGMQKQPINRQTMPNMMQPVNSWKMPMGQLPPHHPQHPAMHRSPGMLSPKPGMNIQMPASGGFNPATGAPKRGYPGHAGVPQYSGMQGQPPGLVDGKGLSMTSPLLVKILQTSSSATTAGTGTVTGMAGTQLSGTAVGEPPKAKRKKPQRRKKPSKNSYTPPASDPMSMTGQGMMISPGMPGHIPGHTHMSPQHAGVRLQQPQFSAQYGAQQVNSPAQYFHSHGQPPVSQMHPGGMLENPKNMYAPYPNGTNMSSPGLHPMGNKASPGHVFSPEQNTAYIETINRSDVGSRLSSGTPTQMAQHRVPTPGHSPSGHSHMTANHMPSSSVTSNMFLHGGSGTVHHGPRMGGGINGMQGHMQMSPGVRMSQQVNAGPRGTPNMRLGVSSPAMQNSPMMAQPFPMQQQYSQHNPQFQSPPPSMNSNATGMYNQVNAKQSGGLTSPAPPMPNEYMQNTPPPNVVINGSDALQQAIASQRQIPGYQKHVSGPGNANIAMQDDMAMRNSGAFFQQQSNSSPSHMAIKNPSNPNMFYNATAAPMAVAGPNNFNNNNNLVTNALLPTLSTTSGNMVAYSKPDENMSDATVTHYPISSRPKMGFLDSGEMSILLKGTCNASAVGAPKGFPAVATTLADALPHRSPRQGKKSPGSATDGHSSSPGSSYSYTPSPAGAKRNLSTSNPSTPLHLDPLGSPTSITMQSHSSSRSTTPRPKSACTTPRSRSGTPVTTPGTSRRVSVDKQLQNSFPSPQQRVQPQGVVPSSPAVVNGPNTLNRTGSRTELDQQYMTSPGTPTHTHPTVHNSRYHISGPPGAGVPSPRMVNQGIHYPPPGSQCYNAPPAYPVDHNFSPQSHLHQHVTDTGNPLRTFFPNDGTPKTFWGHTVTNHHQSPSQTNSAHTFDEAVQSGQTQSRQQTMPNLPVSHSASNHTQSQNCYNITSSTTHGMSPQLADAPSPCVSVSDSVQNPCRTEQSSHFFNNQTQDLLAKKQQEPAATVPLQS